MDERGKVAQMSDDGCGWMSVDERGKMAQTSDDGREWMRMGKWRR